MSDPSSVDLLGEVASDVCESSVKRDHYKLDDAQLVRLRDAVKRGSFGGPDGSGFETVKTMVEIIGASGPQLGTSVFEAFLQLGDQRPGIDARQV